jgi:hypothetical protein
MGGDGERRERATDHAATTHQPMRSQPPSPSETWLACTSRYTANPGGAVALIRYLTSPEVMERDAAQTRWRPR